MSCIILEKNSVQNMLNVMASLKRQFDVMSGFLPNNCFLPTLSDFDKLGKRLMILNYRSYNYRYQSGEMPEDKELSFRTVTKEIKMADICQALKTAECLSYNSSDFDGYEIDTDYKTLCGLIDYLRYCILQSIPEYAAAEWG